MALSKVTCELEHNFLVAVACKLETKVALHSAPQEKAEHKRCHQLNRSPGGRSGLLKRWLQFIDAIWDTSTPWAGAMQQP